MKAYPLAMKRNWNALALLNHIRGNKLVGFLILTLLPYFAIEMEENYLWLFMFHLSITNGGY